MTSIIILPVALKLHKYGTHTCSCRLILLFQMTPTSFFRHSRFRPPRLLTAQADHTEVLIIQILSTTHTTMHPHSAKAIPENTTAFTIVQGIFLTVTANPPRFLSGVVTYVTAQLQQSAASLSITTVLLQSLSLRFYSLSS